MAMQSKKLTKAWMKEQINITLSKIRADPQPLIPISNASSTSNIYTNPNFKSESTKRNYYVLAKSLHRTQKIANVDAFCMILINEKIPTNCTQEEYINHLNEIKHYFVFTKNSAYISIGPMFDCKFLASIWSKSGQWSGDLVMECLINFATTVAAADSYIILYHPFPDIHILALQYLHRKKKFTQYYSYFTSIEDILPLELKIESLDTLITFQRQQKLNVDDQDIEAKWMSCKIVNCINHLPDMNLRPIIQQILNEEYECIGNFSWTKKQIILMIDFIFVPANNNQIIVQLIGELSPAKRIDLWNNIEAVLSEMIDMKSISLSDGISALNVCNVSEDIKLNMMHSHIEALGWEHLDDMTKIVVGKHLKAVSTTQLLFGKQEKDIASLWNDIVSLCGARGDQGEIIDILKELFKAQRVFMCYYELCEEVD
eukprot:139921_1